MRCFPVANLTFLLHKVLVFLFFLGLNVLFDFCPPCMWHVGDWFD